MRTAPRGFRPRRGTIFLAGALAGCAPAAAPDPSLALRRSRAFEDSAEQAMAKDDLPGYLANVREALALRPHHPTLLYHLARAYVVNDSVGAGLEALEHLAAMGIAVRPQRDSGFLRAWELPRFASVRDRFTANAGPTDRSRLAFTLTGERAFLPEGVTLDSRTGTFYVGSVHQQRIVQVRDGETRSFAPGAALWSVMGMTVDTARDLLWVATSAVSEGRETDSADVGRAAVAALDLATGTRRGWYPAPNDGHEHWLGDLIQAPNGDIIASDSRTPALYRLRALDGALESVTLQGSLSSPQGLTMTADGRAIYLADYALGPVRIDRETGEILPLAYPDDATLLGMDGLYRRGRTLIGIQNGVRPHRIVAMTLNRAGTAIERVTVLEANHPLFAEPTLGTLHADTLFYVANSQWGLFTDTASAATATEPRILRLPLPPDR